MQQERKNEFIHENPKTFVIGGDMGDIIYHLLYIKKLGGNKYHIDPSGGADGGKGYIRDGYIRNGDGNPGKFDLSKALFLLPLIKQQSYLDDVNLYSGDPADSWEHYDVNASEYHMDDLGIQNLTYFHAKKYNLKIEDLNEPWIEVKKMRQVYKDRNVVINRTLRYRGNDNYYYFNRDLFMRKGIFVGLPEEYEDFMNRFQLKEVPFIGTNDCLELAEVIRSCDTFYGNGSLAASIALGLGLNINYEFCAQACHYLFERDNIQLF